MASFPQSCFQLVVPDAENNSHFVAQVRSTIPSNTASTQGRIADCFGLSLLGTKRHTKTDLLLAAPTLSSSSSSSSSDSHTVIYIKLTTSCLQRNKRLTGCLQFFYTFRSSDRPVGPTQSTSDCLSDQSDRPVGQTVAEPPSSVNHIDVAC